MTRLLDVVEVAAHDAIGFSVYKSMDDLAVRVLDAQPVWRRYKEDVIREHWGSGVDDPLAAMGAVPGSTMSV